MILLIVVVFLSIYPISVIIFNIIMKIFDKKKLAQLGANPIKIELDGGGWYKISDSKVEIVEAIKKIPGLKYQYKKITHEYSPNEEYIFVSNDVGQAIEMYVRGEGYSDLTLDEFLLRTLFKGIMDTINAQPIGSGDKSSN